MTRPLRLLYSALLASAVVLGAPYWLFRMLTTGRYRAGLADRLGRTPAALRNLPAGTPLIWLHAVSVGEVLAATALIRALARELPGWTVAVSTTTATGQQLARRRLGNDLALRCPVFFLPLDFAILMRRTLRRLQPRLVILMESELWPNMLLECRRTGIPVAVANARISDRSFPRYLRLRRLWRPLFALVSRFLAQGPETAGRLLRIGATPEQVAVTGNLKYDLAPVTTSPMLDAVRSHLPPGSAVLVAGSTLDGEEHLLLDRWPAILAGAPGAILILAPRHPDRFDRVAALIADCKLPFRRASTLHSPTSIPSPRMEPGTVLLLDTLGDLAAVYSLATVALVGGSLVDAGGHNPLEPARFAVPVLLGPSWSNFREIVERMQATDGVRIVTTETFAATVLALLNHPDRARDLGLRGQEAFTDQTGATARTVHELLKLLGRPPASPRVPASPAAQPTTNQHTGDQTTAIQTISVPEAPPLP